MKLVTTEYPTHGRFRDRSGEISPGGMKIIKYAGRDIQGALVYLAECPLCGKQVLLPASNLFSAKQQSCGCLALAVSRSNWKYARRHDRVFISCMIDGVLWTFPITVWAEIVGIKASTIRARLRNGYNARDALLAVNLKKSPDEYKDIHIPEKYAEFARPDKLEESYK